MPIHLLLPGQDWDEPCERRPESLTSCSLPQLLGLCKIRSSESLFASPALFDLILFVLLRIYAKLSRSDLRVRAMNVLAKADEEAGRRIKAIRGTAKASSAREALKEARIEVRDRSTILVTVRSYV